MTLNRYQKANESLHLSEERKEDMIQNILAADTEPKKVRRPFPLVFGTVMAGAFAVLLFVMIPRTVNHGVSYDAARQAVRKIVR